MPERPEPESKPRRQEWHQYFQGGTVKIVCAVIAVLCGVVDVIGMATGSVTPIQVAGFGIIFAALAAIL